MEKNLREITEKDKDKIIRAVIARKTEIDWIYAFGKLIKYINANFYEDPSETFDVLYYLLFLSYNRDVKDGKSISEGLLILRNDYKTLDLHRGDVSITREFNNILGVGRLYTYIENPSQSTLYYKANLFLTGLCFIYPTGLNMINTKLSDLDTKFQINELLKFRQSYLDKMGYNIEPIYYRGKKYFASLEEEEISKKFEIGEQVHFRLDSDVADHVGKIKELKNFKTLPVAIVTDNQTGLDILFSIEQLINWDRV
jgi:hypothetical protein